MPINRYVKSANRAFALLEVFERERRPLRISELVEQLDAPQSSVSMLVKTLVHDGYMDFNPMTREYCPSMRVGFLCSWVKQFPARTDPLWDTLRALAHMTGETVLLGRIDSVQLQYVLVIDSCRDLRFAPVSGTRRPLHRTATGMVLMGALDDEKVALLLRRYNAEVRDCDPPADVQAILHEIARARSQGYYRSMGLATPGASVIAALLATPIRGQRLAVGVGGPLDRVQRNEHTYLAQLQEAISQLAAGMS